MLRSAEPWAVAQKDLGCISIQDLTWLVKFFKLKYTTENSHMQKSSKTTTPSKAATV